MDCWTCERTALGACRFCGRGTCREHARTQPFVLDVFRGKTHETLQPVVLEAGLKGVFPGAAAPREQDAPGGNSVE